jgi:hypothetical protein
VCSYGVIFLQYSCQIIKSGHEGNNQEFSGSLSGKAFGRQDKETIIIHPCLSQYNILLIILKIWFYAHLSVRNALFYV